MPNCKQCGTPRVRWAKRKGASPRDRGAFVLLDDRPDPLGAYALVDDRAIAWEPEHGNDNRWMPHDISCENSRRARSRERGQ